MRTAIMTRLARGAVDAIVADVFMFVNIPDTEVPIVVNNENLEHVIIRRYVRHEPNLADDPALFATARARLLHDPWQRKTVGDGARQRVEEQYAFENLRRGVREAMAHALGREARP